MALKNDLRTALLGFLLSIRWPLDPIAVAAPAENSFSSLVLAAHLTRPEVVKKCLNEFEISEYEFVWKDIEKKEDPGKSLNLTFKLTAMLMRKSDLRNYQAPTVGEASMTIQRDMKRFKDGELFFNCHIEYKMEPSKSKAQ